MKEPHNAVLLLPFPSNLHTQSWKLFTAKPVWSKHFLKLESQEKPLWITASCCICCQKSTACQKSLEEQGADIYDPDLWLHSFSRAPGNPKAP